MKKEILFGAIALLISAGVTAQTTEPVQEQTKTKKQNKTEVRQQVKDQEQTQSGDPIMTKTREKARDQKREKVQEQVQSGDPVMTKTQTRTENHGEAVSVTARETPGGKGKGTIVSEQARIKGEAQKSVKQAKKAIKKQDVAKKVRKNRPATVRGTGAGRK